MTDATEDAVARLVTFAEMLQRMAVPSGLNIAVEMKGREAGTIAADLRTILARLAKAEADVARLDWLERDHNAKVYPGRLLGDFGVQVESENGRGFSIDGSVRQAIDAARTLPTPEAPTDA